jgi:hypothetical protein
MSLQWAIQLEGNQFSNHRKELLNIEAALVLPVVILVEGWIEQLIQQLSRSKDNHQCLDIICGMRYQ